MPAPPARLVSWPMYAVDPDAVGTFWEALRQAMLIVGLERVPAALTIPDDRVTHWRDPELLLSQTCGYPFVTALAGAVRYVATPRFRVPGCEGAFYRSAIVVRRDETAEKVADLAGRRVAFNSRDSQSGTNALRALVASHARGGRFFASAIETGSHRNALAAIRAGQADVAAIDVVTLALVSAAYPDEVDPLRVLGHTEAAPGLPFITSRATCEADIARLRHALAIACDPSTVAARPLRLDGIEILPASAYDAIGQMEARAAASGYPDLA